MSLNAHADALCVYYAELGLGIPYVEYEVMFKGVPYLLRTAKNYSLMSSSRTRRNPRRLSWEEYAKVRVAA